MQSGLEVVGLQFFLFFFPPLWVLFWTLRSLSINRGSQSPLPLTQLASLNPLEKIPQEVVEQTEKKNLGNSICTPAGPMASVWLISHQPQLGPFPRQGIRKRRGEKS